MTESIPASILDGLTLEAVEWLPSGADTGLVRVRGRWSVGAARPEGLPVLCASLGGGVSRYESLPDAPSARANGSVWRGAYLVPEAIVRSGVWLEWASGERSALPVPAGLDERAAPALVEVVDDVEEPGGEVIDRAVMAERRARRAEAAEQAQARVASEALRALDALELRGSELEARVEALVAERAELVARAEALERRSPRDEHQRAALSDALGAAAAARRLARDWQLSMRAAEVARSSDAVRLRVLEAREATTAPLRSERAAQEAELAAARARAAALETESARAREQAVAAATDLDEARRDFARRLEESGAAASDAEARAAEATTELDTARSLLADRDAELSGARAELDEVRAELSEARAYAETALAEARAGAEAELADARAAAEAQSQAATAEIADLGGALEAERAARAAAGAAAETARSEAASAGAALRAESVARATLEDELERERAARSALSDALDAETAALASLHADLNAERAARESERAELESLRTAVRAGVDPAQLDALQDELGRERAARQVDQSALAALRDDLAAERAALAEVRAQLESLSAEVRGGRAGSRDELASKLRAEMESARDADHAVLAALRADLNAERAAREAAQGEIAQLRTALEAAQARLARPQGEVGGRRAAGVAIELGFQRRARQQAQAAAAADRSPEEEAGRVVANLDAAASALRERTPDAAEAPPAAVPPAPAAVPPADAAPAPADAAPAEVAPAEAAADSAEEARAAADAALAPAAAPPERTRVPIVSAPAGPPRAHATGRSQRQYPWLRGALVKLAHDDARAAGRLIAGLLPVQAAIVQGPVDYDITIAEVGTFAVTVAGGRAYVKDLETPRGRREAEFHLSTDALTLAELIAGVPHKIGRFRGAARISGRKRRIKQLRAIPTAGISLAEAARAGARLEPGLVFRTFPYVIHTAWAREHSFTVAQQITGEHHGTWYFTVGNGRGMDVRTTRPPGGADATVTMSPEAFGHLLRGEPAPRGERPIVRGDRAAVALLKSWIDRAQIS